jgi:hypothetical protein
MFSMFPQCGNLELKRRKANEKETCHDLGKMTPSLAGVGPGQFVEGCQSDPSRCFGLH